MHHSLAIWLTERPWRAAWMAALLGVLSLQGVFMLVPVASAIVMLVWLVHGAQTGMNVGLAASAAIVGVLLYFQQPIWAAGLAAFMLYGLPMLLAALLGRFQSLNLVYQGLVLLALGIIAAIFLWLPEPNRIWEQMLMQAVEALRESGMKLDEQKALPQLVHSVWGWLLAMWVLISMSGVCLARWWQSLIQKPGAFGAEFRELRSGNVLGTVLVMIVAASFVSDFDWLDSLKWVAMLALALQGLAAAHRRKAQGQLQHGWLVAIYVLLIVPLFSFVTVAILAGWGLADFWKRAMARG